MVEPPPSFLARASKAYGLSDAREYGWPVWILTIGQAISSVGRGVAVPFIVVYLTQAVGIPLAVVGVGVLIEQLTRALGGPIAGWASDRFGRKRVMMTGLLAQAIAVPGYALVRDAPSFIALSLVIGASQSIYGPASSAYVADVTRPDRRAGAFGLVHVARNLGWAVGIGFGAVITSATPSFAPLFVTGGLMPFLFLIFVAAFIREPEHVARASKGNPFGDFRTLLGHAPFASYMILASGFFLLWGVFNTVLPLFVVAGMGLPRSSIAVPFAINPILIVLFQLPFGALGDRVDRYRALGVAAGFGAAGYAVLAWSGALSLGGWGPLAILAASAVLLTVAEMLFSPVMSAGAAELAPPGVTGSAMGVMLLAGAAGHGLAPVLADVVVSRFGWSWAWTAFAVWTVASGTGMLVLRARFRAAVAAGEASRSP